MKVVNSNIGETYDDEQPTIEEVVAELDDVRAEMKQLSDELAGRRQVRNQLEAKLAELMSEQRIEVGGNFYERGWTTTRTQWDHEQVLRDVQRHARELIKPMVDETTGEIESDWERAFRTIRLCTGFDWRMGGLKMLELTPGEYCREERRRSITVTEAAK